MKSLEEHYQVDILDDEGVVTPLETPTLFAPVQNVKVNFTSDSEPLSGKLAIYADENYELRVALMVLTDPISDTYTEFSAD